MNKARKILCESNWLRDFYFIVKVLSRNEIDGTSVHVAVTRMWGYKILDNKLSFLMKKYPKLAEELREESSLYFRELSERGDYAYDVIHDRFENSLKNE